MWLSYYPPAPRGETGPASASRQSLEDLEQRQYEAVQERQYQALQGMRSELLQSLRAPLIRRRLRRWP